MNNLPIFLNGDYSSPIGRITLYGEVEQRILKGEKFALSFDVKNQLGMKSVVDAVVLIPSPAVQGDRS